MIRILESEDREGWSKALSVFSHQYQSYYYKPHYINLYQEDGDAIGLFYEEGDKCLFVPVIRRPIPEALGAQGLYDYESPYGYCAPLTSSADGDFLQRAWSAFNSHCRENSVIACFARFDPLAECSPVVENAGYGIVHTSRVVVTELNRPEAEIWSDVYSSGNRNKIRKAESAGVALEAGTTSEFVNEFSTLYDTSMNRLGTISDFYRFGRDYFQRLVAEDTGDIDIYLARQNGTTLGGAVVLQSDDIVSYHLSATSDEGRKLGVANALRHHAVKLGLANSKSAINFGGGNSLDENDSLLKFKLGFSRTTRDVFVGKFVIDDEAYQAVCDKWAAANPDKADRYRNHLLKYHF